MYYTNFVLVIFSLMLAMLSGSVLGQSSMSIMLRGTTLMEDSTEREQALTDVEVSLINLYSDTTVHQSDSDGNYRMRLPFNHLYRLCFYKPGFAKKSVLIDTRNISKRLAKNGYQLEIDIVMIPTDDPKEEENSRPVAMAEYHFFKNEIVFNKIENHEKLESQIEEWQKEAVSEREEY